MVSLGRSEIIPAALVFDLDGTIVDTETVEFESIRVVWEAHGAEYRIEDFEHVVGTSVGVDWVAHLCDVVQRQFDRSDLHRQRQATRHRLLSELRPRDGIRTLIETAHEAGVALGVASNSPMDWVEERLRRVGLREFIKAIVAIDTASVPKPHPAPFLEACAGLGVAPAQAVALEDSGPGVQSATSAGLYTVACPGPLTRNHDLSAAHRIVQSHTEVVLTDLGRALAG